METQNSYPIHLKKVLNSYKTASMNSLLGPTKLEKQFYMENCEKNSDTRKEKQKLTLKTDENSRSVAPILPGDNYSDLQLGTTTLEGIEISCFALGGEKRLCFIQILSAVLAEFSLPEIYSVCDELQIFCSVSTKEMLAELKLAGAIPETAYSCGMMTKSNAERLVSTLLHTAPPRLPKDLPTKRPFSFTVCHRAFGKCNGVCTPDWYVSPSARCVECKDCSGLFSPEHFVSHSHQSLERNTCHWGFESCNWRYYIHLEKEQPNMDEARTQFDEFKKRFEPGRLKRKQTVPGLISLKKIRHDVKTSDKGFGDEILQLPGTLCNNSFKNPLISTQLLTSPWQQYLNGSNNSLLLDMLKGKTVDIGHNTQSFLQEDWTDSIRSAMNGVESAVVDRVITVTKQAMDKKLLALALENNMVQKENTYLKSELLYYQKMVTQASGGTNNVIKHMTPV